MRETKFVRLLAVCIAYSSLLFAQSRQLTSAEAKNHVGERATVCGKVVSAHYAAKTKGSPTFLNLDEPYPKQIFTILIWGSDRAKFGNPETEYANKKVCVRGLIKDYKSGTEIIAEEPNQIEVQK